MDGAGEARDRVCDGVNDVASERLGVLLAQRLRAGGFHPASCILRQSAPEDVVLAAGVQADDGPHAVVVRQDRHVRRPDDVEDGQLGRVVDLLDAGLGRRAEALQDRCGIADRTGDDFSNRFVRGIGRERCAAIGDELVSIEHALTIPASKTARQR